MVMEEPKYPPIITLETDDTTAFLRAARSGNLEKVVEYLDTSLDINTANSNGLNALHLASKDGHVEIVTELLKRGAKVDAATKKGNTALHIASLAGQCEIVNILIQYGAAVNIQSQNGFTPLYMAAQENHDQVVKLLLSNGANQSLATEDGFTPLAVAMQQGHDKVVSVLLENDSKGKVRLPALHIAAKKDDCKAADLLLQNDHKPDVTSKSGFTPLHIAAHYGNEEIGRLLIKRGADVNYLAKHNISPLHVAAKWGKNNMVKLLLENSAMIDAKTRDGLTPLHCAARSGHEEVVSTLLENSAPISARTKNGLAPLHMASQGDHVDAARVLLYHRAPVDEVTIDYLTSLHVAAHCGHVRVAKLLLDRKADPNARALNGFTPLHIACKKNRIKVVELLLKHGASIESTTESGLTPLHVASFMGCMNIVIFLLQHEANPDVPTVRGETPLHLAARANQTDIIRILLRNGAKVDARAREEQTPLHIASRLGNVDIVMLLLQHGAAVDTTTKDMYTALHIAAKEGQEEVAAILVENQASVQATTKNGFTPLHIAAKYGNMNVAKILLQKDSKLDSQGKNDITPLHLACHYDHPEVANMILEKGASPHLASQNGHTPLHIAARKNQMDIASTLLEHGADPNAQSKAGFTPLQLSAQKGHYDMTNLLIEHGADPNHKAKNGLTALHLCAQEDSTRVASILVKNGANVESETESGYRPIHVASHFGNLSMIRFLLKHNAQIDVRTNQNYTSLHQAAQQGHAHVVSALVEGNASHDARTTDGLTPLNIAQKLGYISVMEVLKGLPYDTQTPDNKTWEEKYKVIAPESLQETSFMSDSDDEGNSDGLINEQPYRYLTADLMKSLRDDSLPIDVTRDDPVHRSITKEEKQDFTQSNNYCPPENFDSTDGINLGRLHFRSFLVSFLVDARGGAMKGCRHSGIRIIVPPRRATMPIRVTCRLVKTSKVTNPPSLMEGEALATRIIEMGPVGASFLGPVLIDIPHFASVQGKEREIIILRSDNGETWKEHDNSHENDDTLFNTAHDTQMSASHSGRITRIITTEFPQYFAIVTRIKQEVHVIGADGGILISSVANHVQAVFPPGALTKKIKVGLQAHVIPAELTAKLLGNCVAVSPVITIEPRRRKFHKPITLTIPVPQAANKGMINQYGGETPTLRLLCSIAGGTSEAQWEDVTGSTPLTFLNDRVSFTTTVSARFWLMDCRNISEVPKMATELYKESLFVPFITNFVIYTKRFDVIEATLRILCMTDGKEGLHTLEKQEEFLEIVKSRDVETLDGKDLYLEFSGNLVPVTKSGQQLKFTFKAFRQNRLSFHVKVRDPLLDPVARLMFMRDPRVAKGDAPQQPICVLNIVLPEAIKSATTSKLKELDTNIISKMDMYKTTYMRDYGEKRDIPKPTSPNEQKRITDILEKEHTDAAIHESLAQKVACPLESVDASYPNKINNQGEVSPNLEKATYSEKRKFWEDITKKRDSYQRSESEVSRTSQLTINESDSEYLQNVVSEEDEEANTIPERSETMEDLNIPDMSECSVAEKAHYFEEQIQRELSSTSRPISKIISQDSLKERRYSTDQEYEQTIDSKCAKQDRNVLELERIEKNNLTKVDVTIDVKENKLETIEKASKVSEEIFDEKVAVVADKTVELKEEKVEIFEKVSKIPIKNVEEKLEIAKSQTDIKEMTVKNIESTENNETRVKVPDENVETTIAKVTKEVVTPAKSISTVEMNLPEFKKEVRDICSEFITSEQQHTHIEHTEQFDKTVDTKKKPEAVEINDTKPSLIPRKINPELTRKFETSSDAVKDIHKGETTTSVENVEKLSSIKSDDRINQQLSEDFISSVEMKLHEQELETSAIESEKISQIKKVQCEPSKIPMKIKTETTMKYETKKEVNEVKEEMPVLRRETSNLSDKDYGRKESRIPIPSVKSDNEKSTKPKDDGEISTDEKKKKSGIPKRIVDTIKITGGKSPEEIVTVTETKITEKVSEHYQTHTSKTKTQSSTFTKTFTDPNEALKAFENFEMPESAVKTSKTDHTETKKLEKRSTVSSEISRGDEKIIKHQEEAQELKEKSSECSVKTETSEETIEDKRLIQQKSDKSQTQAIAVNLSGGKHTIDASASQAQTITKDEKRIHSLEDDDGLIVQEGVSNRFKLHEIDTAIKIEKDESQSREEKELDASDLGMSLEDELKNAVIHEQNHEESSNYSDTKVFPSRETTENISRSEMPDEFEARNIAENLVQSIEEEIIKRSESSDTIKLGFDFDNEDRDESEDFDEQLADDLAKKFENIIGKRKESQAQVIESVEQVRATIFNEGLLEKDSTRGSLSISEDLTKDEEESFPSSSSQAKIVDRDFTMSPSSMSDQMDIEECLSLDKTNPSNSKPIVEFPTELKVAEEYIEEPREVVTPMRFEACESGARVLEILEPYVDYQSRQDSIDVSSIEIDEPRANRDEDEDELSLGDKYMRGSEFGRLHESPAMESLDKIGLDRDLTFSPSTVSDSSMIPERSLSSKPEIILKTDDFESEDGGFSSMEPDRPESVEKVSRLDTSDIDKDIMSPVVSPRTKLKELEIKPGDWMIGDEKIEICETLQPSQEFDKELEELVKQQSLTSSHDGSGEFSVTRSSEDVSTMDSVKEASTAAPVSKFTVTRVSDSEIEPELSLVEDKLEVSCSELVATLQREYEAKTPTDERIPITPRRMSESDGESSGEDKKSTSESMKAEKETKGSEEKDIDTAEKKDEIKVEVSLKGLKDSFACKTKSLDDPRRHPEKSEKFGHTMSVDSSALKLKKDDLSNVDLSARYAITVLDQAVKKEIAEVKESLEAAKQDLIEELSENSETIFPIKDSPSEFQFKLQPESIPNDLPILYKSPTPEPESQSSDSPVPKPRRNDEEMADDEITPVPASRSSSDVENKDDGSSSLSIPPLPVPRRRQKPARVTKKLHSESEGGSSSGESSNYASCDYESRPSSSDIDALHSASGLPSGTVSEYETALMSIEHSSASKRTSQEYHSAVSTMSSRESMKSLNSLSSGHLGSIDSTGEATDTLIASEADEDKGEIDENLELALDDDDAKASDSSESEIPMDEFDQICGDIPGKMKRSSEMIFQQISEDADISSLVPEGAECSTEDQSTKVTSSMLISEDDDLKTSTLDAISEGISAKIDGSSSSPEIKLKSIEAQSTGDDIDSSELKMTSLSAVDSAEALLLSKRSVLQQASMSTSSTSGVSIETVIERDRVDRHSPDSDSFELVDKPDIIDDFVVVEEVGREAEEFDAEGKSISIKPVSHTTLKKFDRDLENLLTDTKIEPPASQLSRNNELFDFEPEESPPQASNEDQYSQSLSDDESDAKKWMEMQFQADPRAYELEYDRGPLEDIKEEEITDFEAGSSRFGSLGSQKGSIGSSGSMKGSYGSVAEFDVLAGRKTFSKSIEHDNISMNSLQEFENLENAVIAENARRLQQCGSSDSVNNGSLPRRYAASRSGHGDDISVSSLKDFEGMEKACRDAHTIELRAKEEEELLEHESPENRYRLENLPKPKPTAEPVSAAGSFNPSTSGSDDYEKRIMEIDEIIRIAQANVEKFDRHDDTTEDISQIEITDVEKIETVTATAGVAGAGAAASLVTEDTEDLRASNIMETSTDSLELEDAKKENLMCRSSDSLETKTTIDFPSLSYSDSLNNMREQQESQCTGNFNSGRRISSDSLELPVLEQSEIEARSAGDSSNIDGKNSSTESRMKNGKTVVPTTDA